MLRRQATQTGRSRNQLASTVEACNLLPMPIYVYELCEGDCKVCGGSFEIQRPIYREPLSKCPLCRKEVRKVIGKVNSPKLTKPVSVSDAKKAGFSVVKKVGTGEYERE
jgi:putative FmdB family regulatory protein